MQNEWQLGSNSNLSLQKSTFLRYAYGIETSNPNHIYCYFNYRFMWEKKKENDYSTNA